MEKKRIVQYLIILSLVNIVLALPTFAKSAADYLDLYHVKLPSNKKIECLKKSYIFDKLFTKDNKNIVIHPEAKCLVNEVDDLLTIAERIKVYAVAMTSFKFNSVRNINSKYVKFSHWNNAGLKRISDKSKNMNVYSSRNFSPSRLLNIDEHESIEKHFSYNLSFYLTSDQYACKRPTLNKYFNDLLNLSKKCPHSIIYYTLNSDPFSRIRTIDVSRIYSVHYFFASKGEALMSRWGHAMARIVVCSPKRKVVSSECVRDEDHHLIVTFSANIPDGNINSIKGLVGGYPSVVSYATLEETVSNYTEKEYRDVLSLPLNISSERARELSLKLNEAFWSYQNDYKFLSTNCATEISSFFEFAFYEKNINLVSTTPLTLHDELLNKKLISSEYERNRKSRHYLYKSKAKILNLALGNVNSFLNSNYTKDQWLNLLNSKIRKELFEKLVTSISSEKQNQKLRYSFYLLEREALIKYNDKVSSYVNEIVRRDDIDAQVEMDDKALLENTRYLFNLVVSKVLPSRMLPDDSYGLPDVSEAHSLQVEAQVRTERANYEIDYSYKFEDEETKQIGKNIDYFFRKYNKENL